MKRGALLFVAVITVAATGLPGLNVTISGQEERSRAALLSPAKLTEIAPAKFAVLFDTSAGAFTVTVERAWAPLGVDRVYNLVKHEYFDGVRFHRVLRGYLIQFGISGDPEIAKAWMMAQITKDDPVAQTNKKGFISFIPGGAGRRTTQLFINLVDNKSLDAGGAAPFGQVTSGWEVVEKIYADYGDVRPHGNGPDVTRMLTEGNAYLEKELPQLDYIKTAVIVK